MTEVVLALAAVLVPLGAVALLGALTLGPVAEVLPLAELAELAVLLLTALAPSTACTCATARINGQQAMLHRTLPTATKQTSVPGRMAAWKLGQSVSVSGCKASGWMGGRSDDGMCVDVDVEESCVLDPPDMEALRMKRVADGPDEGDDGSSAAAVILMPIAERVVVISVSSMCL